MAVNNTHPEYDEMLLDWQLMRDCMGGETVVKAAGVKYLPATSAHILDGQGKNKPLSKGEKDYQAYKLRASFPDYTREAVEHYVGMMHYKPAKIELPKALEALLVKATNKGESLLTLLRRINTEQLTTGRLGLLLDMPTEPDQANPVPYIAVYNAEKVINWDDSNDSNGVNHLELVVLDETGPTRRTDMSWETRERYRVLKLANVTVDESGARIGLDEVVAVNPSRPVIYKQILVDLAVNGRDTAVDDINMSPPVLRGKALEEIPFVFVNSKDHVSSPDRPPLVGLARLCMTIYRGDADYRHTLYMQGQDTLVTIGGIMDPSTGTVEPGQTEDGVRVGAGARIDLNLGGDAKYIGVSSEGLSEQRAALENDRKLAETRSGQLIAPGAGKQESGDALTTRLSAQTATLVQMAQTGAAALEKLLKLGATWIGANPDEVKVTPNMEFVSEKLPSRDLVEWMTARTLGAPLSKQTIHENMVSRGVTSKTFEEELDLIAEEDVAQAQRTAKIAAILPTPAPAPGSRPQPAPSPGSGA